MSSAATAESRSTGIAVGVLGLLGGIGLLTAVEMDRPLWSVALAVGGPAVAVFLLGWRGATEEARRQLIRRSLAGLQAGAVGLAGYDLTRWGLVLLLGLPVNPFEALPVLGELLTGSDSEATRWAAGVGYHIFNGLGFAVFYAILWGTRGIAAGVLWAVTLELATLAIYPGWLDIQARGEFTLVSLSGHLSYGLAIGAVSAHRLREVPDR